MLGATSVLESGPALSFARHCKGSFAANVGQDFHVNQFNSIQVVPAKFFSRRSYFEWFQGRKVTLARLDWIAVNFSCAPPGLDIMVV